MLRTVCLVGVTLAVFLSAADAAQRRAKREEPAPPPPQFKVDGPTRPMAMQRLALSIPDSTILGKFVDSAFCTDSSGTPAVYGVKVDLTLSHAFPGTPTSNFIDAFTVEAVAAGYTLAGRLGSSDLFSSADEKRPELIVGAAIAAVKSNGCIGNFRGITMETTVTIDWQVFDPLQKQLVLRKTNTGTSKLVRNLSLETVVPAGALEAFRHASKNILSDAEFVAALRPQSGAPVSQASAIPTVVQIPRVAQRSTAFKDQIPDLRQQVVTILTGSGSGSGFYIADGMIMTNHHVVAGSTNVKIRFFGGREIPGEVIVGDHRRDIAIVKTTGGGMLGLPIQFERPQVGAQVFVIGSPRGQEQEGTVTGGIVSAYREHEDGPILQSETAITPGNSGGPMFDDRGNVVAVSVSKLRNSEGVNFFIPIDDAFRTLGIGVTGVEAPLAAQAQLVSAGGRMIQVSMYPAAGPLQKSGKVQPITGNVGGVGGAGTFAFTRPDGVKCDGKWTTLQSKPASGSLLDKHRDVIGIGADPAGMVGGLAIGACSNGGNFQAEYYVVPNIDSGFGAATDSDGNIYKVIF